MKAKMTKTKLQSDKMSSISAGRSEVGKFYIGRIDGDTITLIENADLLDVKVDDTLMVLDNLISFLRCSPISEIIEQSEKILKIKTTSSYYTIEKVEDES